MRRRGKSYRVSMPVSKEGYTGRECPNCCEYFKIMIGTGLKHVEKCYCPYCGLHELHSSFRTAAQIKYAHSVIKNKMTRRLNSKLKRMARNINSRSGMSNSFLKTTVDVKTARTPIRYPIELELETPVECTSCTLKYAVYGVYAYCPDCGKHNAVQMLEDNLNTSVKLLDLSNTMDSSLSDIMMAYSLIGVVSALDGFGREICRTFASKSKDRAKAENIRIQNLVRARISIQKHFSFDISHGVTQVEWLLVNRCFQKRHVLEHKSGVVDTEYKAKAYDPKAIVGRKVNLSQDEVRQLIHVVRKLGAYIYSEMEKLP